jgi:hypothetical protein
MNLSQQAENQRVIRRTRLKFTVIASPRSPASTGRRQQRGRLRALSPKFISARRDLCTTAPNINGDKQRW